MAEGFFYLAGSWEDNATPEEIMARIRKGTEILDDREKFL